MTGVTVTCVNTFALSLSLSGVGNGTVTSPTGSLSCTKSSGLSTSCTPSYNTGTAVTLTATPSTGYIFAGWSGSGCSGAVTCVVTMSSAKSVRATFVVILFRSNRAVNGTDAINGPGIYNIWTVKTDGTGLTGVTSTTAANTDNMRPQWSPDGTKIAFDSTRKTDETDANSTNGTSNIWVVNTDGTGLTPLTTATAGNAGSYQPQWSPDGTKIAFDSMRKTDGTDAANTNNTSNIWTMNADGTALTALTTTTAMNASSNSPQWSPDGTKIAFESSRATDRTNAANTNNTGNIWVVNTDGTGLTPLTTTTANYALSRIPQWSPDGTRIVFQSHRKTDGTDADNTNNTTNIWMVNANGTGLTPLTIITANFAGSDDPQWSPDGTKIVFDSTRTTNGNDAANTNNTSNIWTMNADGSGIIALTTTTSSGALSEFPQWSPDGTKIVFDSARKTDGTNATNTGSKANVWTVNADGTSLTAVTTLLNAYSANTQWAP